MEDKIWIDLDNKNTLIFQEKDFFIKKNNEIFQKKG